MEGCGYRDLQADFDALEVSIIGVGTATPGEMQDWAEEESYEFEIWTDQDGTLGTYYGAADSPDDTYYGRVTKVTDPDGVLVLEYVDDVDFGTHPSQVLSDLEQILD